MERKRGRKCGGRRERNKDDEERNRNGGEGRRREGEGRRGGIGEGEETK